MPALVGRPRAPKCGPGREVAARALTQWMLNGYDETARACSVHLCRGRLKPGAEKPTTGDFPLDSPERKGENQVKFGVDIDWVFWYIPIQIHHTALQSSP